MVDKLQIIGWSGWPLLIIVCVLAFLAPVADAQMLPVRIDQSISDVVRSEKELCFTWTSTKVRDEVSDKIYVSLTIYQSKDGGMVEIDSSSTSIYGEKDHKQWARSSALPPTHRPQPQRYCTALAPFIRPDMTLKLDMIARYPGLLPIWHNMLNLPTVIDPPGAKVP